MTRGAHLRRSSLVTRDGALVFTGRVVRTFSLGALSLALPLLLKHRGLSAAALGGVLTATLVEDALLTAAVTALAPRWGRRRLLILSAIPMVAGGVALALARDTAWLLAAVVVAVVSSNGQDAGPFSPLEVAILPDAVAPRRQTRAFAWLNVAGFLPAALGALVAGQWIRTATASGGPFEDALRRVVWAYVAGGVVLALVYSGLSRGVERPHAGRDAAPPRTWLGLHRSRGIVLQLAGLQALDALAGGFVAQSLLVYWFDLRFGAGPDVLGRLFFGTQVLSALSFLAAARLAERVGLLHTMVFTHVLSNLLLALVAVMPTFRLAAVTLLCRHLFSQMDVPTRQSYTMALVAPDERAPAAGLTTAVRGLAQSVSPALTGIALAHAAFGLPFFVAGGLKIVYDLALFARLRRVVLPIAVDGRPAR
ncbi:MAG TPA: MFS transporter [Vicinamibacteria bacterium]|nr:MFS transporter [Vicinamibacteria bacterium]